MSWVFGYGSLMWRPGFEYTERRRAVLPGFRRCLCRYSWRHRGTPEAPGLVVGLRQEADLLTEGEPPIGCVGVAYQIRPGYEEAAWAYLDEREGDGYLRQQHDLVLLGEPDGPAEQTVTGYVYVPDTNHPTYFGSLDTTLIVNLLRQGRGFSGTAMDYLRETVHSLEKMEVPEPELKRVLTLAEQAAD